MAISSIGQGEVAAVSLPLVLQAESVGDRLPFLGRLLEGLLGRLLSPDGGMNRFVQGGHILLPTGYPQGHQPLAARKRLLEGIGILLGGLSGHGRLHPSL
jgi:hypothetical protein